MAEIPVRPKRGSGAPAANALIGGELAVDWVAGAVYLKLQGGGVVNLTTPANSVATDIAAAVTSLQALIAATDGVSRRRAVAMAMML
ncbi:MAG: hypothetical protein WCO60_18290 [Verrucomicrobiota bacterium]